jgi:chitodextrinase
METMTAQTPSTPANHKLQSFPDSRLKKYGAIIFIVIFALIGCYFLFRSFAATSYDSVVLGDHPVAFWGMKNPTGTEQDLSGHGLNGTYKNGAPALATMLNGDRAVVFNGSNQYMTVGSNASLSIPTTGQLTWEAWIRPDTLQFPNDSGYGYIDWMGKCHEYGGSCEYEARMYNTTNPENRCNRLSAYVFNQKAGLGSAGDWQPVCNLIRAGQWLHVVGEYQTRTTPAGCNAAYPGSIDIWVNGVKWNQSAHAPTGCMSQYQVKPGAYASPLNIGTMAYETWFKGAIGKVAIYNTLLSQTQISNHFTAMTGAQPSGSCASSCTIPVPTQTGTQSPADTTKPSVNITSPANGATVNGSITIAANASDNVGVTKVEFYDGSTLVGSSSTQPYSYMWNTKNASAGSHTLTAKAYDAANNVTTSAAVQVTVTNTTADTTQPSVPSGLAVMGVTTSSVSLSWNASTDNVGVTGYRIYRYGGSTSSATVTTTSFTDSGLSAGTAYNYTVSAIDAAGNASPQSSPVAATTKTPSTPPPAPTGGVAVTVTKTSTWSSGYCSSVSVKNSGATTINGWSATFDVTGRVTSLWNANWQQSGSKVTITNPSWKATLTPGQTYNETGFCAANS